MNNLVFEDRLIIDNCNICQKKIYIYTKNHKDILGIKTHIDILKNILSPHKVVTTNRIKKNSINIFIENFKKKM